MKLESHFESQTQPERRKVLVCWMGAFPQPHTQLLRSVSLHYVQPMLLSSLADSLLWQSASDLLFTRR